MIKALNYFCTPLNCLKVRSERERDQKLSEFAFKIKVRLSFFSNPNLLYNQPFQNVLTVLM